MAENFCQNATKKITIDKRCPFPISHSVPFLLPLSLIFFSIIPTGNFFCYTRKGNGIIRQAVPGSAVVTCSMRPPLQMRAADVTYVRRKAYSKKESQEGKSS